MLIIVTLELLVRQLADMMGEGIPDWRDGHARWQLYRQSAENPDTEELLKKAAENESDLSIASAIVVMMLERVEASRRQEWVAVLNPSVRSFAENRSQELEILESIVHVGGSGDIDLDAVDGWSDWLQRKVVQSASDARILSILADLGRTKRIRRLANEALTRRTS